MSDDLAEIEPTCIHLWFPGIFEFKGGIQVYCTFVLKALQCLLSDNNSALHVFLKHDRSLPSGRKHSITNYSFCGGWPSVIRTPIFAAQLILNGLMQRPSLILVSHLHFSPAALLLKYLAGIRYWVVAHGIEAWNIERTSLKIALRNSEYILAVSEYTRDRIVKEYRLNPSRVLLLPNTFDENKFHIQAKPRYLLEKYGLSKEHPVILTVARLDSGEQYKGYDRIIQALPKILQKIPKVHYVIVGKGDDFERIGYMINDLGLQKSVTLAGFVPEEELCDYYNFCDVFAMPSKGEGFGIVFLEALGCGKPVLAGNKDGSVDALCKGELGVLVDPDSITEIEQNLISILQGRHINRLIYCPIELRKRVIDRFGFGCFKRTLAGYINEYHVANRNP